jgi:putative transposase
LTAARKNNEYLGKINAQSLQQTLRRLEKAFVSMWEQNHGFPRFKKVGRMRSFSFPQLGKNPLQNGYIKLPVIGKIKLRQSRSIHASCFMPGNPEVSLSEGTPPTNFSWSTALAPNGGVLKQARVVKRVSGWYVMLTVQWDVNPPQTMPHGEGIGIDVGLTSMVATSNGLLIKRPRFFVDAERKLKLLQQRVSSKRFGSNNWLKALRKVAKLHEYVANCRKDWHRKLSHQLCDNVGMIFVEDLNLVGLSRGMLGKHCLDAGFGQFFNILEQTCFKRGVYFQKVDARKTSQICPLCQHETGKKTLAERVHKCDNCGYQTDRDVAAAQVVLIRGLAAVGHTVKMLSEGKFVGIPVS